MKRGIAIFCILIVAMSAIFAQAAVEGSASKGMTDVTVMVYERGATIANGSTLDNNDTRWLNDQLAEKGVHLTFVGVPRSGADATIETMIAAGTAPDVIVTNGRERVMQYGSQGGLVDFTPYLDRLDPEYQELIKGTPINMCSIDGGLYALPGMPGYFVRGHEQYIRKDLVEALGMEMPDTREELIEFLYAVKKNYPDMIPYAFSGKITDACFFQFVLSYTSRADERTNFIYEPSFTNCLRPGAKEGFKQLNQFYLDGIIPADFALDVDETKFNQARANGKVAFMLYNGTDTTDYTQFGLTDGFMLWPANTLPNADGDYVVPSSGSVNRYVYVLKSAEDAGKMDAIMEFLSFMSNEDNANTFANRLWSSEAAALDETGAPYALLTKQELMDLGYAERTSDMNNIRVNFDFGKANYVKNQVASAPNVPVEFFEEKYDVTRSVDGLYHLSAIPGTLPSDTYMSGLQTLICEFALKVISAPAGQFEKVWEESYAKLVENHLEDVLNDRAAWYDANH